MAAGITIKSKRKAGAFTGGELAAGEFGVDVSNDVVYQSSDGATVWSLTAGAGDALTTDPLSQFAATTSAQLAGVISDETGTGLLVFATSPTLTTPVLGVATATTVNGATITTTTGTLTLVNGSTLATSGAYSTTLTATGATNVTLPTTGTLANQAYVDSAVAGGVNYQGGYNAATNTPDLDTTPSGVLEGHMYTVTAAGTFFTTAVDVGDVIIAEIDSAAVEADWTIVEKNLDGAALTGSSLAQFAATSSAELAGVISDETGSGLLVFATSPTLTTPNIGVATATTVNKVTITAPATSATLTLSDASSLITVGGDSITLTSSAATNVTLPTTGTLATIAGVETLTSKTISDAASTIDGGTI